MDNKKYVKPEEKKSINPLAQRRKKEKNKPIKQLRQLIKKHIAMFIVNL